MSGPDPGHDDQAAGHLEPGGHDGHHDDTHDDEHGHEAEPLGPIDWRAWAAAGLGIASAFVVMAVMYLAINPA